MRVKTTIAAKLIAASLLIPFIFTETQSASAAGNDQRVPEFGVEIDGDRFIPVPQADVTSQRPVILAQADGQRVLALEETIRQMNGKVEELTFQILQMQEQMRKMQEDNEFRFQELEKSKQGRAQPAEENTDTAAAPADEQPVSEETTAPVEQTPADIAATGDGVQTGEPERPLGSIQFDENGNVIGGSVEQVIEQEAQTAALPAGSDPAELYRVSYDHVLAGEYKEAELGFRQHIEQYPADEQTADARYWLGESLAAQGRNRDAAEVFLAAQKDFPKSKKAPEMLFKLGVSLVALDNKDVACATFNQVTKKYPKSGQALLARVAEEQSKAGC
jgi:tol-pal system protein YbgF